MPHASVHRYGPHASQSATLYTSQHKARTLTCLLHGGFWRVPHGPEQLSDLASAWCEKGHLVLNVGYRRIGEGGGWPHSVRDVADAVMHALRALPDVETVTLAGHSAGGYLAFMAGPIVRAESTLQVAVVGLAPILTLESAHRARLGADAVAEFMGQDFARITQADPRALLPLGIRQHVVHGLDDVVVPIAMSREFGAAAIAAGDPFELIEVPGLDHMGIVDARGTASDALEALIAGISEPSTRHAFP